MLSKLLKHSSRRIAHTGNEKGERPMDIHVMSPGGFSNGHADREHTAVIKDQELTRIFFLQGSPPELPALQAPGQPQHQVRISVMRYRIWESGQWNLTITLV